MKSPFKKRLSLRVGVVDVSVFQVVLVLEDELSVGSSLSHQVWWVAC